LARIFEGRDPQKYLFIMVDTLPKSKGIHSEPSTGNDKLPVFFPIRFRFASNQLRFR
jgi:hypothetical protein